MATGVVKEIKTSKAGKRYGFISGDGEEADRWFSAEGIDGIIENARVTFGSATGEDGRPQAKNVRLAGSAPGRHGSQAADAPPAPGGQTLPPECVFKTFYSEDGQLDRRIFYEAADKAAKAFDNADVTPTSYRRIYQQFLSLIKLVRRDESRFPAVKEQFNILYVEKIVYGARRGKDVLKPIVKDLFDRHKDLALSDPKEMRGFFQYVKNILCYTTKGKASR
jgi:cold shock CspA family protein